jgi:3-methyladenine DNA glycosylase Mpg
MTESRFTINQRGLDELFSDSGDVGRYAQRLQRRVVFLARRYVGKRTHRLERSIRGRVLRAGDGGIMVEVTAHDDKALMHHDGTRPHLIYTRPGRALRFSDHGRIVYARVVHHPGTRPNPFLARALREAIRS